MTDLQNHRQRTAAAAVAGAGCGSGGRWLRQWRGLSGPARDIIFRQIFRQTPEPGDMGRETWASPTSPVLTRRA